MASNEFEGLTGDSNGRSDSRPLNILIVGAGIGGLTAAVGLRKNGHNVTVYEQSQSTSELGAAVILAPNANGIIKRLGIDAEKDGAVIGRRHTEFTSAGELKLTYDLTKAADLFQHSRIFCHRVAIHKSLKTAAISPEGDGPPVNLIPNSRVVDLDVGSSTIVFEDGSKISGDCIVGADGVKSVTRTKIHGLRPFPSGKSAYRFLVEREKALNNPLTADLVKFEGAFSLWYGRDRRVWMYSTHFNQLLNIVCMHPDSLSETPDSKEAFGGAENRVDHKANMMKIYKEFNPNVRALLELAEPSSIRLWKLLDMNPPSTRVKGNLCLLGDAALPFLPYLGVGAGCAMEDAASLTVILSRGTSYAEIPERLRLYEECRMPRSEKLHSYSRLFGLDFEPANEWARVNKDRMALEDFPYIFSHDEYDHSTQRLRELLYKRKQPLWNMPASFGPMPGPRQTFYSNNTGNSRWIKSTVKFKTSRTLLQNLLPSHLLAFVGPGSIADASFTHTAFSNVSWLGDRGYDELGFYIHGVQCIRADGSSFPGSFLAVMFVNVADALSSDREDLGIPKIFCNLQFDLRPFGQSLKASWQQTQFAEIRLNGLAEYPPAGSDVQAKDDIPIFTHRYIPPFGNQGKAIVDSLVCLPVFDPRTAKLQKASSGDIQWKVHDEKDKIKLPTLHHIVMRLAELPILEVVEAFTTRGVGMGRYDDAFVVPCLQGTFEGGLRK